MLITSSSNPAVKQIRGLRERKERERAGLFFVEGIRLVVEAAQLGADIRTLVVAPALLKSDPAWATVESLRQHGVGCLEVSPEVFVGLSHKAGPQGIGAVVGQRWESLDDVRFVDDRCWVALDEPQDPGNIGAILRTADATGCAGIFLTGRGADPYDPSALRASMGAVFSQRLVKTSFPLLMAWKQRHQYTVVGTSGQAEQDYRAGAYRFPLILLMGSERQGLTYEQQSACDVVVKIPMVGRSDSLNLAVATGVMLYELLGQRRRR